MRAGDLIVRVNGQEIKGGGSRQVVQLLREVRPDSKVKLRVERDGKARDIEVVARAFSPGVFVYRNEPPPGVPDPGRFGQFNFQFGPRTELRGLEVTTLTPQLGRYFGTSKGVLVVRAPSRRHPEAAGWGRDPGDRRPRADEQLAHRSDSQLVPARRKAHAAGDARSEGAGRRRDAGSSGLPAGSAPGDLAERERCGWMEGTPGHADSALSHVKRFGRPHAASNPPLVDEVPARPPSVPPSRIGRAGTLWGRTGPAATFLGQPFRRGRHYHARVRRSDFAYHLPEDLIAQTPLAERSASRLLVLDGATGALSDLTIRDLPQLVRPGDLLVFNDTRVVAARLVGFKPSGGRVEIFLERAVGERQALVQLRASKAIREELEIATEGGSVRVVAKEGDLWKVALPGPTLEFFERWGEVPLPPYIHRTPDAADTRAVSEHLCSACRRCGCAYREPAFRRGADCCAGSAWRAAGARDVARGGGDVSAGAHR